MKKIHLDQNFSKTTQPQVFATLKFLLSPKIDVIEFPLNGPLPICGRLLLISDLLGKIKDGRLLDATVEYLKFLGWLHDETQIDHILFEVDGLHIYDKKDKVKIKALAYSALLKFQISALLLFRDGHQSPTGLVFKCRGRKFYHNGDDLISESIVLSLGQSAKSLSYKNRLEMLTELVNHYSLKEFQKGKKIDVRARKYFYSLKQNYLLNPPSGGTYPFINREVAEAFVKYVGLYILEPYVDHSYLFQRLKHEKLLVSMSHKKFMKWLLKHNHISPNTYDTFTNNGFFRSLEKSTSINRENNFNNLFEKILS